ncbi:hypothetical protein ACWGJQ_18615 [Peribacillus simplex]
MNNRRIKGSALNGQIVAKYDVINKKIIQKIYMVMELQLQASLPQRKRTVQGINPLVNLAFPTDKSIL